MRGGGVLTIQYEAPRGHGASGAVWGQLAGRGGSARCWPALRPQEHGRQCKRSDAVCKRRGPAGV